MRRGYLIAIFAIAPVLFLPTILNYMGFPTRLIMSSSPLSNQLVKFSATLLPGSLGDKVAIVTGG